MKNNTDKLKKQKSTEGKWVGVALQDSKIYFQCIHTSINTSKGTRSQAVTERRELNTKKYPSSVACLLCTMFQLWP